MKNELHGFRYYFYDGHGNVRALTSEKGEITDTYSYDAYGNLLQAEGETKNDFLYTGEQYNASTGLYYLRARYMNPSTGTFISMDSYQGNTYDPITLHKYLYANANPVMNTDPTGYMAFADMTAGIACRTSGASGEVQYNQMIIAMASNFLPRLFTSMVIINVTIRLNDAIGAMLLDEKFFQETVEIEQIISLVNEQVKEDNKNKKSGFTVYTLVDKDGIVRYVGRTRDYEKRMEQHRRPGGKIEKYDLEPGKIALRNLTEQQARGLEQSLMVFFHTKNFMKDITIPYYNFINGVGPKNVNREKYYDEAKKYMDKYPTLMENILEEEANAIREMNAWW